MLDEKIRDHGHKNNIKPRNDWVLIRMVDLGTTEMGIAIPETSQQAKQFRVLAVGHKVEKLCAGDRVLLSGVKGAEYFELPDSNDLIMVKEEHVVAVLGNN